MAHPKTPEALAAPQHDRLAGTRRTDYASLRYYYTYDGNGNVSEIINYNDFNAYSLCAHFEYNGFGNLTRADHNGGWSISRTSPFRFSTKWHDNAHLSEQGGLLSLRNASFCIAVDEA